MKYYDYEFLLERKKLILNSIENNKNFPNLAEELLEKLKENGIDFYKLNKENLSPTKSKRYQQFLLKEPK